MDVVRREADEKGRELRRVQETVKSLRAELDQQKRLCQEYREQVDILEGHVTAAQQNQRWAEDTQAKTEIKLKEAQVSLSISRATTPRPSTSRSMTSWAPYKCDESTRSPSPCIGETSDDHGSRWASSVSSECALMRPMSRAGLEDDWLDSGLPEYCGEAEESVSSGDEEEYKKYPQPSTMTDGADSDDEDKDAKEVEIFQPPSNWAGLQAMGLETPKSAGRPPSSRNAGMTTPRNMDGHVQTPRGSGLRTPRHMELHVETPRSARSSQRLGSANPMLEQLAR